MTQKVQNLKIWIDFINTPQVSFWVPFIKEFRESNHEIILTCRDSGNTIELLKQQGLDYQVIGEKVGNSLLQKLFFFPRRIIALINYISKRKPDIAVSQSSFYQPIVSRILGIFCLYTNDNEHAKGNLSGFLFANSVLLPIALKNESFTKRWPLKSKIRFYPSVKESIYLSQQFYLQTSNSSNRDTIYFRPEPWSAQYYKGPLNFFDETLILLSEHYKIVVLPRDKNQIDHFKKEKFKQLTVSETPIQLHEIITKCKLFIGAGGSMSRELAVLGVPVISIYQDKMLCVDKYLVENGYLIIKPDISYEEIKTFLMSKKIINTNFDALNEGLKSYQIFKELIFNYTK